MPSSPIEPGMKYPKDSKIWRYMDLAKYLNLIRTRSLYLPSLPKLEDEWEGATGAYDLERDLSLIPPFENRTPHTDLQFVHSTNTTGDMERHSAYVSCWHANESESEAMWKLYGQSGGSLAVQTTIESLESVGPSSPTEGPSAILSVRYRDLTTEKMDEKDVNDMLGMYAYKRPSFSHEQEVRLIHKSFNTDGMRTAENTIDYRLSPWGKNFEVDLSNFIHKVVISPKSPSWFIDVVKDTTVKYGFNFPVEESEMNLRPTYGFLTHFRTLDQGNL